KKQAAKHFHFTPAASGRAHAAAGGLRQSKMHIGAASDSTKTSAVIFFHLSHSILNVTDQKN
ncbi:hypothetical protein OFB92_31345, partial [Escherichia coli]|nr:hypothetical protein [Escherichia coli]